VLARNAVALGKSAPRATASPAMKSWRSSSTLAIAPSKASLPSNKWCGSLPEATASTMALTARTGSPGCLPEDARTARRTLPAVAK